MRRTMVRKRQREPAPHIGKRIDELMDQAVVVPRRRRNAQPLGSPRHGRIVDRLNVNAVLGKQQIARRFAALRITDKERNNMAVARHHRQRRRRERGLGVGGAVLVPFAFPL